MKSRTPLYSKGQTVVAIIPDGEGSPVRLEGRVERVEVRRTGFVYYALDTRPRLLPEDRIVAAREVRS